MRRFFFSIFIFQLLSDNLLAQQNSTLFFMQTPQANYVNPAIRNDCKWIIGLPLISSIHAELGNQAFSFHQILKKQPDNSYLLDGNDIMSKLSRTNYINSEVYANLLYLGFWHKGNYFTFSINEKADLFTTYPRDFFALAWNGNSRFEGKTAYASRSAASLNYRHEIAFGIAREYEKDLVWGTRVKILFGSMNSSFPRSSLSLFTDPANFDLTFQSDWKINTLLPITVSDSAGRINSARYNGNAGKMLLSFSNIGVAFDFGFIKYKDKNITISGSILDIGLIRWTGNTTSFSQKGNYTYTGSLGDSVSDNNFAGYFLNIMKQKFGITASHNSYISFLNPSYYFGSTYRIKEDLNAGLLVSGKVNKYKITSGITVSLNKAFQKKASFSISWSYLYKNLNNLGFGTRIGFSPMQFYFVSDNIPGLLKPLDSKNLNVRFGIQITPGCSDKKKKNEKKARRSQVNGGCGCAGIDNKGVTQVKRRKHLKK